ncbi:MAG: orotidine-5'-phosphate decarboxylase [Desulfonatronovibrio sp.]
MSEIIIALDFDSRKKALDFVRKIASKGIWVKVGLELFIRSGPGIVEELKNMGLKVFLDLKLMDIPNTVYGAVSSSLSCGADMITLHTLGGEKMINQAKDARAKFKNSNNRAILLGVTLLTSLEKNDLPWSDARTTKAITLDLAMKAHSWGLDGCVCSGLEAQDVRKSTSPDFCLVTPGIRMQSLGDDQKRVVTPESAEKSGSDFLVIGRPVTQSPDPVHTLRDIKERLN